MTEAAILLEQARALRALAPTFDQPVLRYDVLRLAEWCEELAPTAETGVHHVCVWAAPAASSHRDPYSGFIEEISEPTHEALKDAYAYWLARRSVRIAPSRSAIRLADVATLLPNIALIDVIGDPPRFYYHLCGTRLAEVYGENVTGKFFDEVDFGSVSLKRDVIGCFTRIARECCPQVARLQYTKQQDGRQLDYERIALPLSRDATAVNEILCVYAYHRDCFDALS
jgi:hypothetical protein